MWKKRFISATAVLAGLVVMSSSIIYAENDNIRWKKFYNEAGETVYYPENELKDFHINGPSGKLNESSAPETAAIGDIFQNNGGYERVFAVSEDGAYMTEWFSTYEEACNRGE
ncbi:hypothetical protein AALB52_26100 [Lachnospiraceae bacterium 38-14]|nr:hypothetical protein [Lachnospiraceae bacterium]